MQKLFLILEICLKGIRFLKDKNKAGRMERWNLEGFSILSFRTKREISFWICDYGDITSDKKHRNRYDKRFMIKFSLRLTAFAVPLSFGLGSFL